MTTITFKPLSISKRQALIQLYNDEKEKSPLPMPNYEQWLESIAYSVKIKPELPEWLPHEVVKKAVMISKRKEPQALTLIHSLAKKAGHDSPMKFSVDILNAYRND